MGDMSSFKHISDTMHKYIDESDLDVITLADDIDTIKLHGKRYRKANFSSQDWIYHWLLTMRDFKKIYRHSYGWYCECKPHACPMECKDSIKE